MARVFVGIGSNIDPERNVRSAVAVLRQRFGPLTLSPVYASAAWGFDGAEFYNLVAGFDSELSPEVLTAELDAIEQAHGRVNWEKRLVSRTLDLDLLAYGDAVLEGPDLRLPRQDILRFAFVLKPLADIAPQARHPRLGQTYAALWAGFPAHEQPLRRLELTLP